MKYENLGGKPGKATGKVSGSLSRCACYSLFIFNTCLQQQTIEMLLIPPFGIVPTSSAAVRGRCSGSILTGFVLRDVLYLLDLTVTHG